MIRNRSAETKRDKLLSKLPMTGELLRGSLLERTIRHTKDCPKCRRGEGHQVFVLTVTYPGSRTRQYSVRREKVAEVSKKWFRVRDTYGVEIEPGQDDILILAVTVCIDQMAG